MRKEIDLPYNYEPRGYQLPLCRALDEGYKRAVAVWHRRSGKDKSLLNIMVKEAFKRVGIYYYFFPTYKQGRMILWDGVDRDGFAFLNHIPEDLRASTNNQEMKIKLTNGSMIQVVGTDDIDRIVGTNPVGCVFSEYALQRPEAWDFIRPILRENDGWAIFNFTPRGLNHGYSIYKMAVESDDWFCELLDVNMTLRPDGSPVITLDMIEKERAEGMSENMIMQEYYCDFTASSDDVLIGLDLVMAAAGKVFHPSSYMFSPKVLGVDVARYGDDRSVIAVRQGLVSYGFKKFKGANNMEIADVVANMIMKLKPEATFIDAGRGEGVIDRLRQLGFDVVEVNFGATKGVDPHYVNKRAEMWDGIRKWLMSGGAIPDDMELRTDLSIPTYSFDAQGRLKLMAKDKMKELYGYSPDCADALALTFAAPVAAQSDKLVPPHLGKGSKTDYNMLEANAPKDNRQSKTEYSMFDN